MQVIICECGTELPFNERDLSLAAGKPFTCPNCGRTRKLPLANVFTPALPTELQPGRRSTKFTERRRWQMRVAISAAVVLALLLVLTGWDQVADISGTLITIAAAVLMLVHAMRRDPQQRLAALALAALGGQVLSDADWPSIAGLTLVAIALVFQRNMKEESGPPDSVSGRWRLGTRGMSASGERPPGESP